MPRLPDHFDVIKPGHGREALPAGGRSRARLPELDLLGDADLARPRAAAAALLHPDDCVTLGVAEGDRVELGNERGKVVVHARPRAGRARGVVVVEGIWPNRDFEGGLGINALTSAEPGYATAVPCSTTRRSGPAGP